ncbi:MAG: hypothetical protein CL569_04075 [Alphaproteobacteria bacterium]|nr:hypothetical protein [Alphaproteobacteria bacterium]
MTYKLCGNAKSVLRFRSIIEKHARTLAQETSLNFREVPSGKSGEHFAFWFAEPNEMIKAGLMVEKNLKTVRRAAFRARCYFLTYTLQTGAYIKSLIVINRAEKSADLEHCLLEEMTQVLGLPNDIQLVSPSIFNDNERYMELTRMDRFLLRTLYDDRMLAGTPRKLALILARGIMLDLGEESGWAEWATGANTGGKLSIEAYDRTAG